jgi:hypothetical protein
MVSVKTLIGTVFAGLLLFGFAKPALAEATVSVDRNPVPVNESFELLFSTDYTPTSPSSAITAVAASALSMATTDATSNGRCS